MIQVQHLQSDFSRFFDIEDTKQHLLDGHYDEVALVTTNDLDRVFELTNNISHSWIENDAVLPTCKVIEKGGCRSTSVGDVFFDGDDTYVVAPCGFEKLDISRHDVVRARLIRRRDEQRAKWKAERHAKLVAEFNEDFPPVK